MRMEMLSSRKSAHPENNADPLMAESETSTPAGDATRARTAHATTAWLESLQRWMVLGQGSTEHRKSAADVWMKVFHPEQWMKAGISSFDAGLERVLEGPKFSNLWPPDEMLLTLSRLAAQRVRDSSDCHRLEQQAWKKALDRFAALTADTARTPPGSFRAAAELWMETADAALLEMHRSPEFLDAQRRLTRSATDYRLKERELAELYCEANHLPTRTEVDDMQRTLWQLRREVRALKRSDAATAPRLKSKLPSTPTAPGPVRQRRNSKARP
jgi:poly[(R)-3-hydroxyalkanoate] polymerase subunit PhaE